MTPNGFFKAKVHHVTHAGKWDHDCYNLSLVDYATRYAIVPMCSVGYSFLVDRVDEQRILNNTYDGPEYKHGFRIETWLGRYSVYRVEQNNDMSWTATWWLDSNLSFKQALDVIYQQRELLNCIQDRVAIIHVLASGAGFLYHNLRNDLVVQDVASKYSIDDLEELYDRGIHDDNKNFWDGKLLAYLALAAITLKEDHQEVVKTFYTINLRALQFGDGFRIKYLGLDKTG